MCHFFTYHLFPIEIILKRMREVVEVESYVSCFSIPPYLMQVDVKQFRKATIILQWMGMNALIIYALAACDLIPAAVQGFYWGSPKNNLVRPFFSTWLLVLL